MAKAAKEKQTVEQVEEIAKLDEIKETIVVRPRMKLTNQEFKVLEENIRTSNENSEIKIVLIPHSCELVEDNK